MTPRPPETAPAQPRIRRAWYIACESAELKPGQHRTLEILEAPIVLFRDEQGVAGALLDRCPHRNVPLSTGRVVGAGLACGYHGWRFDQRGECTHVPALVGEATTPGRRCAAFPVKEQQGYVWIWADAESAPDREPWTFRLSDARGYLTVRRRVEAEGSVHAVAENALDVPHTAFAHGGLFRVDADRNEIACRVTRRRDSVECEYIGEPRPKGLVGKVLSPSGGVVVHFDRFHLPSIVEVEYRIGDENHILVNAALTPTRDHHTILHAVVAAKTRIPLWLILPFVEDVALKIFAQDQEILAKQTATLRRFGDARFVSTELDALGPHILRLMRQLERGELEAEDAQPYVKTFKMRV